MADVAFVEFLKGGAAAAAARRASTLLSGASPAASAFGTLASPLRPLVQQMQRVSAFEIRDVLVGGHEVLLARRQDGRYETCRMVLLKTFPEDKVWTLQDSLAFLVVSMRHEALEEVPRLNIVVVPGKISTKARNDAFEPRQQRVVPLSAEEVQLFAAGAEALLAAEANPLPGARSDAAGAFGAPTFEPRRASKGVVMAELACTEDDLLTLPLLALDDVAILYDLHDLVIGSFVQLGPKHFRIVVPCRV